MKLLTYIAIAGLVCFISCRNGKSQTSNYKEVANEKLTGEVEHVFSPDSSYVLSFVETKGTAKRPQNFIQYIVHDLRSDEIVFEESVDNGSVGFYSDRELKIVMIPGIMRADQTIDDHTYIYNIKTKEKRSLKEVKTTNDQ